MSIEEIIRRVVRAHLGIIALCVLIPLAAVVVIEVKTPVTWDAKVRMQVRSTAPTSSTEADGLSSRVLALATTPSMVEQALPAKSGRDATKMAAHNVFVDRLGESSVVELSVTDQDRDLARTTATRLADEVISFMNRADQGRVEALQARTAKQLAAAGAALNRAQQHLANAVGRRARGTAQTAVLSAQNRVNDIRQQAANLALTSAQLSTVVPVDVASPAVDPQPSALVPRAALALLLGLLVGLAIAVGIETIRPRMGGIRELARALEAPVLGTSSENLDSLASSFALAARRQGVETVVLLGADQRDERVARQLLEQLPHPRPSADVRQPVPGGPAGEGFDPMDSRVHFADLYGVTPSEEASAGVIVVSSGTTARRDLDALDDLLRTLRWPMVGVVQNSSHRSPWSPS